MSKKVERFEDLFAWQKAKALAKEIYSVTKEAQFKTDFALANQVQRAAVSVMSNVAEGFERGSRADFHRFVVMAKASCAELRSQLILAYEIGYLSQEAFDRLILQAEEVSKILGGLKASLAKANNRTN